jgi:hypothetical protein
VLTAFGAGQVHPRRSGLRRYWLVVAGMLVVFTVLFVVVEALEIPLLSGREPPFEQASPGATSSRSLPSGLQRSTDPLHLTSPGMTLPGVVYVPNEP